MPTVQDLTVLCPSCKGELFIFVEPAGRIKSIRCPDCGTMSNLSFLQKVVVSAEIVESVDHNANSKRLPKKG